VTRFIDATGSGAIMNARVDPKLGNPKAICAYIVGTTGTTGEAFGWPARLDVDAGFAIRRAGAGTYNAWFIDDEAGGIASESLSPTHRSGALFVWADEDGVGIQNVHTMSHTPRRAASPPTTLYRAVRGCKAGDIFLFDHVPSQRDRQRLLEWLERKYRDVEEAP